MVKNKLSDGGNIYDKACNILADEHRNDAVYAASAGIGGGDSGRSI